MGNVPTINAIPTQYKGTEFRSRTEARWAVFLDELGIEWEYEPEGYQLLSGWYLPDFWLPKIDAFLEVKPSGTNEDSRWGDLVAMTGKRMFVTDGAPGSSYPIYGSDSHMPAVELSCYAPRPACDHSTTQRVRKMHSSGFHVCEQCLWCGAKVRPGDQTWLKHQPGDELIPEWMSWPDAALKHKRRDAYGRDGGYFDAPYFFCQCLACGEWGCEFDGRSARIPCRCGAFDGKNYTAQFTAAEVDIAANYRFWNPGGAS